MEPRHRLRLYLLTALVLFGFGALLTRLYDFQINKREFYKDQVPGNRQITVREPGIRGIIKDRNGIELARNRREYEVSFNLEEIHNAYRLQREKDLLHRELDLRLEEIRILHESIRQKPAALAELKALDPELYEELEKMFPRGE